MPYLHLDRTLTFTSSQEVIIHYTGLIDALVPQLQGITQDNYHDIKTEIAKLRYQLANELRNFGYKCVDEYFRQAIDQAESDQEMYALSNAYEHLLEIELKRIKVALHTLRTT